MMKAYSVPCRGFCVEASQNPLCERKCFRHSVYIEVVYKNGMTAYGTGTMVSKNCLVTAAHVAYDLDAGGYPVRMNITPGGTYSRGIFGTHDVLTLAIPPTYLRTLKEGNVDYAYDYAVISMKGLVGNETGYMGLTSYSAANLKDMPIWSYGYPKEDKVSGHLWYSPGNIDSADLENIYHSADIVSGDSGGPVVRRADPNSILGITTCDLHSYSNGQLVKVINGGINFRAHALSYIRNVIDRAADDY